ncbi:MAG: alpha/beta hydrolase [Elusimicrobiales bacterium]|nr:alpha/beta hydrolase [Elusimicrobiales bacterium]
MEKYSAGSSLLAYARFGPEDGFPLVFLHGATVDHVSMKNSFEQYFRRAGRGYARYYIDLPGHGESDCPLFRAGITEVLNDLGSFLRYKFARPPCLVGYSMGGFLALKLAEATPFPALFLIAPPVYTDKSRIKKPLKIEGAVDELSRDERKSADSRYLLLAAKKSPETLRRYKANLTPGFFPARWIYQARLIRNAIAADLTINPRKIASATAFLVGQQDLLVGYRDQFELSSKLKFSEYHSFYDCGHFLPVECSQFGSLFLNWLETAAAKCGARG